jgi:hypothetical protein
MFKIDDVNPLNKGSSVLGSIRVTSYSGFEPSVGLKLSFVFVVILFSTFVEFQASPNCGVFSLLYL